MRGFLTTPEHALQCIRRVGAQHRGELSVQRLVHVCRIPEKTNQLENENEQRRKSEDRVVRKRGRAERALVFVEVAERRLENREW